MRKHFFAVFLLVFIMPAQASVSLRTPAQSFEIGSSSLLHCFFSTVSANLEPAGWGSRFPVLMNDLYRGGVAVDGLITLRAELTTIQNEPKRHPASRVVWDIERRDLRPPWGDNISGQITDLSNFFVTSNGDDLFAVFFRAITAAERSGSSLRVE